MKLQPLILLCCTCLFTLTVGAQESSSMIHKGQLLLGGTIDLSFDQDEFTSANSERTDDAMNLGIAPEFGYMVSDRFAVGLAVGYSRTNFTSESRNGVNESRNETTTNSFALSPFARYYWPVSQRVYLHTEGAFIWESGTSDVEASNGTGNDTFEDSVDITTIAGRLRPGASFFITNRLSLETTLIEVSYASTSTSQDNSDLETDSRAFQIDYSAFSFGIRYFLR
ncbi:MAG: outer membrane beta-barrel protein [Bacteroidota bacterium]